jgi:uroporphyrinogen decarboxylase
MQFYMDYIDKVIDKIGDYVEVLVFGDDLGHQGGPLISPEVYRELFKPAHKKMWEHVHSRSSCKVFIHSCGSLYELIPDMIDAGLDILNPVQTNAANMEPERLKREFGKDLIFWGGGCEPRTLALKGPEDVRKEVKQRIDIFGKDGGFVFASLHNITAEVPAENIIAMFEAANEYGGY